MHVDTDILRSLTQESLESDKGIEKLEAALASLYKALLSSRDRGESSQGLHLMAGSLISLVILVDHGDMAATMQNMQEYDTHNRQFCTRLVEYLSIMFKFQVRVGQILSINTQRLLTISNTNGSPKSLQQMQRNRLHLQSFPRTLSLRTSWVNIVA